MRTYKDIDAFGNEYESSNIPDAVFVAYSNHEEGEEYGAWVPWSILKHYPDGVTLEEVERDLLADEEEE